MWSVIVTGRNVGQGLTDGLVNRIHDLPEHELDGRPAGSLYRDERSVYRGRGHCSEMHETEDGGDTQERGR